MNPNLAKLQPYPFEKLTRLKQGTQPPQDKNHIALSIGEPKHDAPQFVLNTLRDELTTLTQYPKTAGLEPLRAAISDWATRRFQLKPETLSFQRHVLPVNGTREALFAFTQAVFDASNKEKDLILMPNPFYQIYEGAALIAGGTPYFLNCEKENDYLADFDSVPEDIWKRTQIIFICTPGNPTGSVISLSSLEKLIALADKYEFTIASDECYSELYFDEQTPPPGLLQACAELGRNDYQRCVVFHSLSKRSNLPGLRSGFVAGDETIIQSFLLYRTYHGCAMPTHSQLASIAAWNDEQHVIENRALYKKKFSEVIKVLENVLPVEQPQASFYLWPKTPIGDTDFARGLYDQQNVTVLPGSFLARDTQGGNPGSQHVRMALVAPLNECIEAAKRIKSFTESLA